MIAQRAILLPEPGLENDPPAKPDWSITGNGADMREDAPDPGLAQLQSDLPTADEVLLGLGVKVDRATIERIMEFAAQVAHKRGKGRFGVNLRPNAAKDAMARVAAGKPPLAHTVRSLVNAHEQRKFDAILALAHARDLAGLRAFEIKGCNSYSRQAEGYRAAWVAFLEGPGADGWVPGAEGGNS